MLTRFTYTSGPGRDRAAADRRWCPGIGNEVNGARIWIQLGPFSLQPGEVAKVLLVVAFAGYLVQHRDALALAGRRVLFVDLPRGRDLGPVLGMWLISLGILVFQNDLGSSLLFFGLFLVMLYVATERPGWLVVGGALFLGGALAAWRIFGHVQTRVDIWLDPFAHYGAGTDGRGEQPVEALFGMAWGGLIGRGFGDGDPGSGAVRGVRLHHRRHRRGARADRADGRAAALRHHRGAGPARRADLAATVSASCWPPVSAAVLALQVFVVVGGVTGLIPLTGLTTPFLSYGGCSLVANWVIVALLLRVSDLARRPLPDLSGGADQGSDDDTQVVRVQR